MTIQEKITGFFQSYLGTKYKVIAWYDESEEVEPEGEIAINVHSIENVNTFVGCSDYKISITINGQILTEEDEKLEKINAMYGYIMGMLQGLTVDTLDNSIDNVAGLDLGDCNIVNNGDTNNIECNIDIYVCDLVFDN